MKNKDSVFEVYNTIIDWFDSQRNKTLTLEKFYIDFIQRYISAGDSILDVGCGTGEPIAKFFIDQKYNVTGVDASQKMVDLCKQRFPSEEWILADMSTLNLQKQFNLVLAWHSLFHLQHDSQKHTLKLLASHVKTKGLLVFTTGSKYSEEWVVNGGCELYQASLAPNEYQKILEDNNFELQLNNINDPACGSATVWVFQKR